MLREINSRNADPEGLRDIRRRPAFDGVEIEHLELPFVDPLAHPLQCLREKVLLPGCVPFRAELRGRRVGDALNRRCSRVCGGRCRLRGNV